MIEEILGENNRYCVGEEPGERNMISSEEACVFKKCCKKYKKKGRHCKKCPKI